jgi:hypothetical protein
MVPSLPSSPGIPVHRPDLFRISCSLLADSNTLLPLLILPEQATSPQRPASGIHALMLAVLAGAIHDFQQTSSPTTRSRRLAQEAEAWLWSDNTRWPFSFLSICEALDFEPSYLRRELMRIQRPVEHEEEQHSPFHSRSHRTTKTQTASFF